jgi:hypothetical protein
MMYQKPSMIYEATILIRNGSLEEALRRQSAGNNNAPPRAARICSKSGRKKELSLPCWFILPGLLPRDDDGCAEPDCIGGRGRIAI